MRVATYYNNKDVRIEEREIPSIGNGELLVKIRATGICGSDVAEWYRLGKVGRVLGHEVSGEIVKVGQGVDGYKEGDRVICSHHVPCYECHYCRLGHHTLCDTLKKTNFDPGGFAEWVRLPAINVRYGVYLLPENLSFEEGTLVEPLACTLRAQRKAGVRPEQTILVLGSGVAGLLHILLARTLGATRLIATDVNDYRLKAAKECGADFTFHSDDNLIENIRAVNEGRLADVVIVCAGKQSVTEQSLQTVDQGGTVLFFALHGPDQIIPLPMNEIFWKKGLTLMNSYAASPEDHREALDFICQGRVNAKKIISHRLPFADIGKGFEMVATAKDSLKVIVDPTR